MYQRFNISLRLPLHLFVGEKSEQIVMDKIEECYSKINTSWTLKFWVDNATFDTDAVLEFSKKYKDIFKQHRVSFKSKSNINVNDYVLFDVEDPNNPLPNASSRYTYKTQVGELIPKGLDDYTKISNFILSVNQRKIETSKPSR